MERFSVLSYNVLHGLEVGRFWVRPGEPTAERTARFKLQYEQLAKTQPDVMLLQEVNPLPEMAEAYVEGLRGFDLSYSAVHQADACGLRLGSKFRMMPALNNGLAVLAKAPLRIQKLRGLKLSGGFGGCGDLAGLQTGSFRYALLAEVEDPATGMKIIAVSLHLHSGIERSAYFVQKILDATAEGHLEAPEDFQRILNAIAEDQARRLGELRTLLGELQRLLDQGDYAGVVIGGDFNFEPHSPEYQELERAGLRDSHCVAERDADLHTYDPQNPRVDPENVEIPTALSRAIEGLAEARKQAILDEYRKGLGQSRRIDFVFTMPKHAQVPAACVKQELFGAPSPVDVETGSDHYGVLTTYHFDRAGC